MQKKEQENYSKWSKKHNITDKKAFSAVNEVLEKYNQSRSYLQTKCYWYSMGNGGTGSWYDRWAMQQKMALLWFAKASSNDFRSNVKSPMSRGRINTFVNQIKQMRLEFGAKPNNPGDKDPALVADTLLNYWYRNSNAASVMGDVWEACATHGIAYTKLSYVKDTKDIRLPILDPKKLDENQKKEIETKKVIYGEKQQVSVKDDIVMEYVDIREIYPDPMGLNFHGDTNRCGWVIRKQHVTLEWVKAVYANKPGVCNLDKVKGASAYRDSSEYFFESPRNDMADNIVELYEYENQDEDKYIVLANDIPILGADGELPLPNNHKELSYHKFDFIRVPGQFYSMGICDLLENIQGSYEIMLNMAADYIYRSYNVKFAVDAASQGEVQQGLQRSGNMFFPVDISDGRPISSKIMQIPLAPVGFDIFQLLSLMEQNATLATNIDPTQMALMASSNTATGDLLNKQLLMTMIGGVVENNSNGDLRSIPRQLWRLMQQFYTVPRVKKILGKDEEKTVPVNRTIRLDGMRIDVNPDTSLLEIKEDDTDYSFFEIKSEYLDTKDELDIFVKPESKELQTQQQQEQRMGEEFAQLMPFAVDPNNAQQVQQHQMPMVDAVKLLKHYFKTRKLPEDFLLNKGKTNTKAIKDAEKHVMEILAGKTVAGVPGQSTPHLEYEYAVLDALMVKFEELGKEADEDTQRKQKELEQLIASDPNMAKFDPMTGMPVQVELPEIQPDPRIQSNLDSLSGAISRLEQHIIMESMPAAMRNSRIMAIKQNRQEAMPPMPAGMMEAPMIPGGANPIDPSMINPADPASQIPMQGQGVSPDAMMAQRIGM